MENVTCSQACQNELGKFIFEHSSEGLALLNPAGAVVKANPFMKELFQEIQSLSFENILRPRFRKDFQEKFRNCLQGSTTESLAVISPNFRGNKRALKLQLQPFYDEEKIQVLVSAKKLKSEDDPFGEIEQIKAQLIEHDLERDQQFQAMQQLPGLIARNFPNGSVIVLDTDLNYVFIEGKEMYAEGLSSEQLIGTCYLDHLAEGVQGEVQNKLVQAFAGENLMFDVAYHDKFYELNVTALPNELGIIQQILLVEHNITHQKKAEARIRDSLEKERQLNELKTRFVSMASHEFRTPLSTIMTSASLLERYQAPEKAERRTKHINRIKASVRNLTSILDDFLSHDKLETGNVQCQPVYFDLEETLNSVADEMRLNLRKGQKITLRDGENPRLYHDAKLLQNILINLLSNAIKYSPENEEVSLNYSINDFGLTISVVDRGMGIPKEDQKHLFDRFFRATNVMHIQGTGLGLNIVCKYLSLMGGKLDFKSKEGLGSEFIVSLPINMKHEKNIAD